jgi:hypothetical protein
VAFQFLVSSYFFHAICNFQILQDVRFLLGREGEWGVAGSVKGQ